MAHVLIGIMYYLHALNNIAFLYRACMLNFPGNIYTYLHWPCVHMYVTIIFLQQHLDLQCSQIDPPQHSSHDVAIFAQGGVQAQQREPGESVSQAPVGAWSHLGPGPAGGLGRYFRS